MASEKHGRRRRPPPTIELQATEIASEAAASERSEVEGASEPRAEAGPSGNAAAQARESARKGRGADRRKADIDASAAGAPEQPAAPRGHGSSLASRFDRPWILVGTGLAGAAIALLVVAGIWMRGGIPAHQATVASTVASDDVAALAAKVAVLDLQVRDLAGRAPGGSDRRALSDLTARLAALEQQLRPITEIEARLAKLEAAAASRSAAPDPALAGRLAAAEAAVRSLDDALAALKPRVDEAGAAARDAKGRADAAALEADKAAGDTVRRAEFDGLEARMAAIEQQARSADERLGRTAADNAADRAARLAVVAVELRGAVERGVPFAAELAAARQLAADQALLDALAPLAPTGVPTVAALGRELSKLAAAMLAAAGTPPPDRTLLERLEANAEHLVRIRPVEEVPGDDPSTVIARAEIKASHSDIPGALAEVDRLPPPVKALAAAWIKSAEGRIAAVEAAKKLATDALDALGKPQ